MSLFDWVATGFAAKDKEVPGFAGSFAVTIGNAVLGYFGSYNNDCFGPYLSLVCDPEAMLLGPLKKALPVAGGLLAGSGGRSSFTYGPFTNAVYVGPNVQIRRAPSVEKVSMNILARVAALPGAVAGPDDPIDKATSIAVAALSFLLCATTAALELAIRFKYPEFGSGAGQSFSSYGDTPKVLEACSYTIPSRLMALINSLEQAGSFADFGAAFLNDAKNIGKYTVAYPILIVTAPVWGPVYLGVQFYQLNQALGNATAGIDFS